VRGTSGKIPVLNNQDMVIGMVGSPKEVKRKLREYNQNCNTTKWETPTV
jgi:hypothetical protein